MGRDGFPNGRLRRGPAPAKAEPAAGREPGGEAVGGGDPRSVGRIADAGAGGSGDRGVAAALLSTRSPGRGRTGGGCERQPKGRRREPNAAAALAKENERLKRDLGRQQTLVRLAQRSVGLSPPPPSAKACRKRKPTTRALVATERLRAEADRVNGNPAAAEEP